MKITMAVIVLALVGVTGAAAQIDELSVSYQHLAGNIYWFAGPGANIAVSAGPDGFLMVDSKIEAVAQRIRDRLHEIGYGEPAYIINTHYHDDHTGGNPAFELKTKIVAHSKVKERMEKDGSRGLPTVTFDDEWRIHFNDEDIVATYVPNGHTESDVFVYFTESKVAHVGDLVFTGTFPFVDLENGGTVQGLIDGLAIIVEQLPPDTHVMPGHGLPMSYDALVVYHEMVVETTKIVTDGMKAGKTLAELKAKGLPDKFDRYGSQLVPFEGWIDTIYESYSE